jgi:hypothetical protein
MAADRSGRATPFDPYLLALSTGSPRLSGGRSANLAARQIRHPLRNFWRSESEQTEATRRSRTYGTTRSGNDGMRRSQPAKRDPADLSSRVPDLELRSVSEPLPVCPSPRGGLSVTDGNSAGFNQDCKVGTLARATGSVSVAMVGRTIRRGRGRGRPRASAPGRSCPDDSFRHPQAAPWPRTTPR